MTPCLLGKKAIPAPEGRVPEVFEQVWPTIPSDANGYLACLEKANFFQKADLPEEASLQWLEGRFFWGAGDQETEVRWQQYRKFDGTLQWHIVIAGFPHLSVNELGFDTANAFKSNQTTTTLLEKSFFPAPRKQLVQKIWKDKHTELPFYYQWTQLVPDSSPT